MDLRDAAAIAAKTAGQDHFNVAILRDGKVRAQSPHGGVEIDCPAATLDVAVEAGSLLKMLKAAGKDAALSIGKGRKLVIKWGKSSYSLQSIPEDKEPPWPEMPPDPWTSLGLHEVAALCLAANATTAPEWSMRLHPHWCLATDGGAVAVVWVVGKIIEPVSIAPMLFRDLSPAPAQLIADTRRVYLRCGDQTRWAPQLAAGFHDSLVDQMVDAARKEERAQVKFPFASLALLAHDALAAVGTKAQIFRLEIEGSALRFVGGEMNSAYGARRYEGEMEVTSVGKMPPAHLLGITPDRLSMLAKMFEGFDHGLLSIGSKITPLVVWSGDKVVVEVFCVPGLLE